MTILCYHDVDGSWESPLAVTPGAFDAQMAWLARHRRVVKLDDAVAIVNVDGRLPSRAVALTFDDGFAGVYRQALSALARHRFPATVFLVAQTLTAEGRVVDWVRGAPPGARQTLTRDQIMALRDAGVRFGSHSYAHRILTELSEAECLDDLRRSREVLEDLLGEPVRNLAYPAGRHDARVRAAAGRAGFSHAFALPEARESRGPLSIPRVGVYRGNGAAAFRMKCSPRYLDLRTSGAFRLARAIRGRAPAAVA
jgi:peptidoglycan/xylan/chitin deacetylase (PgdA/CDA1 family)